MNGIEKITERIKSDTQRELQTMADESRAKCEEITAAYKEQAQSRYWKIVSEGKKDAERVVELRKSSAQTESKKRMLQLKQGVESVCGKPPVKIDGHVLRVRINGHNAANIAVIYPAAGA